MNAHLSQAFARGFDDEFTTFAHSRTSSFDDIDTGAGGAAPMPHRYERLGWHNFYVVDAAVAFPNDPQSGYSTGITSGTQVALNAGAEPCDITVSGSFTLQSVEMTAAWDSRLVVDIYGSKDGVELYHDRVKLTDLGPTLVSLDYVGIDDVKFVSTSGKPDPNQNFTGNHIAFDDFVFTDIVKDPAGGGGHDVSRESSLAGGAHWLAECGMPSSHLHTDLHAVHALA